MANKIILARSYRQAEVKRLVAKLITQKNFKVKISINTQDIIEELQKEHMGISYEQISSAIHSLFYRTLPRVADVSNVFAKALDDKNSEISVDIHISY